MTDAWRNVMEQTPGDPNIEDLQKALGPPPPEGYVNVILAIESVLLRREWDVGFRARGAPRDRGGGDTNLFPPLSFPLLRARPRSAATGGCTSRARACATSSSRCSTPTRACT